MDIRAKLQELKQMHDGGLITAAVYEQQQQDLLAAASTRTTHPQSGLDAVFDPRKNLAALKRILLIAVTSLAGIWLIYSFSGQQAKDSISQFASQTGIGKQVIPWTDRADTAARKLVELNKVGMASAIQAITNPTGSHPLMTKYGVSKLGEHIQVEMTVSWKGGVLGGEYNTTVVWEVGAESHLGAHVTFDSALANVKPRNAQLLDEYFLTKVYPTFVQDMGTT
ncbi:MAG: SHOCT domain-containing protein [Proteobacteria bacterium]|nr:SHOCT domain-containing protein [Pseudomonadota bacterium]